MNDDDQRLDFEGLVVTGLGAIEEVRKLATDTHRLVVELTSTLGRAATRSVYSIWEQEVTAALGLEIEGKLPGGEHGAIAVRNSGGESKVLKVFPIESELTVRQGVQVAQRLRSKNVPVPEGLVVGAVAGKVFTLQDMVIGRVPLPFELSHARQLLEFWEVQLDVGADLALASDTTQWPEAAVNALTVGNPNLWCDHGPIRNMGDAAMTQVLDEISRLGSTVDPSLLRSNDALHWDASHRNVLAAGDKITAVIDWEAGMYGDSRLDLITMAFWASVYESDEVSSQAAETFREHVELRVSQPVRGWLAALLSVHQMWFVSRNRPDRVSFMLGNIEKHLAPMWRI